MIAVIDYDTGNLCSVTNALRRLGAEFTVTSDHAVISGADHVILPGVGEAATAMAKIRERGLDRVIPRLQAPVLGICIGMQLMCRHSEEGDVKCLGIFDTDVTRLPRKEGIKIPHIGWNSVDRLCTPLFRGVHVNDYFYFVHSYKAGICYDTAAVTTYGVPFSAALCHDNFLGVQFHPEKSGELGARILRNFLKL